MSFQYPPKDSSSQTDSPSSAPAPSSQSFYAIKLPTKKPYVTYGLIAVTLLVYLLQMAGQSIYGGDIVASLGMKSNQAIEAGQWWRLFTPMLLHGGIFHIGFNMYALYVLGPELERFYGGWRFFLLYLVAGFAGNAFSFVFSPYNSLGASTAIFGLLGAEGVFLYQHKKLFGQRAQRALMNIIFIAVINLAIGLSPGIDNWGHLGGLIGGTLFAWFAGPKMEVFGHPPNMSLRDVRPALVVLLVAVIDLMLFIALAMALGGAN